MDNSKYYKQNEKLLKRARERHEETKRGGEVGRDIGKEEESNKSFDYI